MLASIGALMNCRDGSVRPIANLDLSARATLRFSAGLETIADTLFWCAAEMMIAVITFLYHDTYLDPL
jgi:hypothetical protein